MIINSMYLGPNTTGNRKFDILILDNAKEDY
jgi:hypothetical protein